MRVLDFTPPLYLVVQFDTSCGSRGFDVDEAPETGERDDVGFGV
jgi:hypothetical protein